jgi:hypothetical protein
MLRITCNSTDIEVRFYYDSLYNLRAEDFPMKETLTENRRCSVATVSVNGVLLSQGVSICHPKDNFCRAMGRKRALAHALSNNKTNFNKETRTVIWNEYKDQCKI